MPIQTKHKARDLCDGPPFQGRFKGPSRGTSQWLCGKESTCNAEDIEDATLIPGSGKSPGGGNGNPLQYSCLEIPMDRETWRAAVQGITKSQSRLNVHMQNVHFRGPVYQFLCLGLKYTTWRLREGQDTGVSLVIPALSDKYFQSQ